jgi:lipopolysaccharide transport system ATP-binding protein
MSDIAIRVENLGKQYRIGTRQRGYKTLRESLMSAFAAPFRRLAKREPENRRKEEPEHFPDSPIPRSPDPEESDTIWALKDVSFSVARGEVIGIIGRNGAGKSTLLKILSRITKPTKGRAVVSGRVSSLLEVGTGFHPELTGRENIYLNGAILGMRKAEIDRKFDEIVSFAEVEKFIDTPVKHFSSGMYVRLAFAVAAHLEPEILLVDEVLAVGDAAFQKKCMNKMGDASQGGKTVLFVSHNMGAMGALCSSALLLDSGVVAARGEVREVVSHYLGGVQIPAAERFLLKDRPRADGMGAEIRFESVWAEDDGGARKVEFKMGEPFSVMFTYAAKKDLPSALIAMRLETLTGQIIIDSWDSDALGVKEIRPGLYTARVKIDPQDLHPGLYQISLVAAVHLIRWLDKVDSAMRIEILSMGQGLIWRNERNAILARILKWERTYEGEFPG